MKIWSLATSVTPHKDQYLHDQNDHADGWDMVSSDLSNCGPQLHNSEQVTQSQQDPFLMFAWKHENQSTKHIPKCLTMQLFTNQWS